MSRPTVIWDDGCSFCGRSIRILRTLDVFRRLDFQGSRDTAALSRLGVTPKSTDNEIRFAEPGRGVSGGYDALVRMASHLPLGWLAAPILGLPPLRALGRPAYRWVAARRTCRID
ncbi:MAG: DUF393 domain-containing protein [Bryobacteraceae bacterium]|nr:DUF393 domain-containing protein [Bryobacteraceae bacterium]